ncbi:Flp family type IVb pilin [Dyella sp. ASV21]|uniref:Flp family type IVb pilin n=1 Tax=Dyella sp. ASV21 TaxID=2795114 RepID=UPI0018EC6F5C|nr:Flp family type IVb pilin [Dyella sp. ASV21]
MNTMIRNFLKDEDGISALEYGILAAVVAAILIGAFKTGITGVFNSIITALQAAVTAA